MQFLLLLVCLFGLVFGDNSTIDNTLALTTGVHGDLLSDSWGEWTSWSKWSSCTKSCGGGLSRQQRRCKRKPCKGKSTVKFKICNNQVCDGGKNSRGVQCSAYDSVPYSGQFFKWYPHYDSTRPCSLICRGIPMKYSTISSMEDKDKSNRNIDKNILTIDDDNLADSLPESDTDESIIVELAENVEDGTKCHADGLDVCIGGTCMTVGCDMKVGSSKTKDMCGVCGGNGSNCLSRYSWSLESISACSKFCGGSGGGSVKVAVGVCKSLQDNKLVDESYCNPEEKPSKTFISCNIHPCPAKWITGDWSECSASCGGGSRTRIVFCVENNKNETIKLSEHQCNPDLRPAEQEMCNIFSCPMWDTSPWSECSVTCGNGIRTRIIECRDGDGKLSSNCDPSERPHDKQNCKINIPCSPFFEETSEEYPLPPMAEKLIDQPIPSQPTFIADEWSTCSATCGEGIRHREVHCKIFLDFTRTITKLPDYQCTGQKPVETEKCIIEPCKLLDNSLSYRVDTVGDSGYEESNLMDSYRSSGGSSDYESNVKVAPGNSGQTTYSWKEAGYSACTASCLGGVQDLIINCVRDDTGKTVIPLLCTKETKPESRVRTCNDHACTPRWNFSDFSQCNSPCGIGIQTRDVNCIHEVARGPGNTVVVPNHMCQTPPPVDRQHCNVWDCSPEWKTSEWEKCSKSCGGGMKKRRVVCEQIMAQGHLQIRSDRECQGNKPSSEKFCNTKPCDQIGLNVQPIIYSQNITFDQKNAEDKIDLKIGGTATVFQGISMVKIRCPVKKFNVHEIIWTKDRAELHKSRKYKISKKGALKIVNIGLTDSGIYACIAGQSHAELRLIVKHRTREQMSSEEILRFGNTARHRQDIHLDSGGAANSGENLQINHAAPGYQGTFGNDDLSHESRPDQVITIGKPTKKPRRKRPKPSPASSDSISNGEYTVTSIHQPGHHESVESTSSSSASNFMPPFSRIISTLKSFWPFKMGEKLNRKHRVTSQTENDLNMIGHNSVIPDHIFGPDEERIYIDDDLFEFNFNLDKSTNNPKKKVSNLYPTNYIDDKEENELEKIVKNTKKNHGNLNGNYLRNERGTYNLHKNNELLIHDNINSTTIENVQTNIHSDDINDDKKIVISGSHSPEDDEKLFDSGSEMEQIEDSYEDELTKQKLNKNETNGMFKNYSKIDEVTSSNENSENIDQGAFEVLSNEEAIDKLKETTEYLKKKNVISKSKILPEFDINNFIYNSSSSSSNNNISISNSSNNSSNLFNLFNLFNKEEDLIFEWVTSEWSKCSQTCGEGGFQMRGAQCTVRSKNSNTTITTKRIIGASLCEDAGFSIPEKVRPCGSKQCPQWHTTQWTPCESSRCFNWKTAMQKRDVICQLVEEVINDTIASENITILNEDQCDDSMKPPQRQECYNDACKGAWKVGEWSECTASCEEDGIKYRILNCVWFGTKKPAGNACRDIPRPPVMKVCKGLPCPRIQGECEDHSNLCNRVKIMNMCQISLYRKQCCKSCKEPEN